MKKCWLVLALVAILAISLVRVDAAGRSPQSAACSELGNWLLETPATSPQAMMSHAMAFDGIRRQIIMYGGMTSLCTQQSFTNETWAWDGTNWQQKFPALSPSIRVKAALAYDEARGKVVLFGGAKGSTVFNETWTWDGVNWFQESPATNPGGKLHVTMAYDAVRGKVVMFGGLTNTTFGNPTNETWTWDGANWTLESPATSPAARGSNGLAFDRMTGEIVLFGGYDNAATDFNDTWVWDGTNWMQKSPATSPPAGYGTNMVYSDALGKVVLMGGISNHGANELTQAWVWDGTDWTEECGGVPQSGGPTLSATAYDPVRAQIVLFGGRAIDGCTPLNATQTWPHCAPCLIEAADVNCDGVVNVLDVVEAVNHAFRGFPPLPPCCP